MYTICGRRESFIKKFPLKSVTAGEARPLEVDRCDSAPGIRLKVPVAGGVCKVCEVCVLRCGQIS